MLFFDFVGTLASNDDDNAAAALTDSAATFTPEGNGYFLLNVSVDAFVAVNKTADAATTPVWAKVPVSIRLRGPAQDYAGDSLSYIRQGADSGTIWISRIL